MSGPPRLRVAVMGGRGVIGGEIVAALRRRGHDVTILTHDRRAVGSGYRYADMLDASTLPAAVAGTDVVVQSANFRTYPVEDVRRGRTFEAFDGVGTERLVAAARDAGVRRYVFVSGAGTDARSPKPYFRALWRGEEAVVNAGLEGVCVQPTLVFNRADRGLNRVLAVARWSPVLPVLGGDQLHQPVFGPDVGEVAARLAEPGAPVGRFAIGGPERFPLVVMVRRLLRAAGRRRPIVRLPVPLVSLASGVLERLPFPLMTRSAVDFLASDFVADNGPVLEACDVRLTPFEEGLRTYL